VISTHSRILLSSEYLKYKIFIDEKCFDLQSWSCALLEKPPIVQPLKKFPVIYGTCRFITVVTRALYLSLS
jgi:hypothetical protein